jgi:hypothetical protein
MKGHMRLLGLCLDICSGVAAVTAAAILMSVAVGDERRLRQRYSYSQCAIVGVANHLVVGVGVLEAPNHE